MKFVFPEFLWAFLLLAIPVVIHLFNFKRYKTLYFSSLTFLKSVTTQTKSIQKLKHIITLLLRILAISSLILAFAQPFVPNQKTSGGAVNEVVAVYIDNSFSMQAKGEGGNLLSEAKEAARTLIENLPLGTSFMLLTNELNGNQFRFLTKNEFQTELDKIAFYPGSIQLNNLTKGIERTLENEVLSYNCQLIMMSDFQQNTIREDVFFRDSSHVIHPVKLKPKNTENIFIDSVWFDQPLRRLNQSNNLFVRVVNYGPELKNVALDLDLGEFKRQTLADLKEQGETILTFNYTDNSTGWKNATVEVADQQLYFDDAFYLSYEVKENMEVLIVNDDASLRYPEYVYETESFFNVNSVSIGQLKPELLQQYDVLVINGIRNFSSGLQQIINDFLAELKSVILIPSGQSNINSYNNFLNSSGMPIIRMKKTNSLQLNKVNYDDPFFVGVFDKRPETINLPRILTVFEHQSTSKTNANPLVQFENDMGLIMQSGGKNKLTVFYAGLDDEFGKFHEHILFSTILLRAGELSRSGGRIWFTQDQDDAVVIRRPAGFQGAIKLRNEAIEIIPPSRRSGNLEAVYPSKNDIGVTLSAGHYGIYADETLIDQIAVNLNRNESIPSYLEDEEIIRFIKQSNTFVPSVSTISSVSERDQFSINKPVEYWRILLILGIIFLFLEMVVTALWKV